MTLHIYDCETAVIRSEMVKRTKVGGVFYGLRLHMNTDQTVTFWSKSMDGLIRTMERLSISLLQPPSEAPTVPGQLSGA